MEDGIIHPESKEADELGFTSEKFKGWLWKVDDEIYISFIQSLKPKQGNLSKLIDTIESKGYKVKVPNPVGKMKSILNKKGFKCTQEYMEMADGMIDVYIR